MHRVESMVSSTDFRKYGGNGALYLTIDKFRQRTFLRRNIAQALEHHAESLAAIRSGTDNGMVDHVPEKDWDFPDRDTMRVLSKKNNEVLRIDIKHILPAKRKESTGSIAPPQKKTLLFSADCSFVFKLYTEKKGPGNEKGDLQDVLYRSRRANLQAYRNEHGEKAFSVDMAEPFYLNVEELKVQILKDRSYRTLLARSYTLTIHLCFPDPEDLNTILPLLNNNPHTLPEQHGKIYAKLRTLPQCPADGKGIALRFTIGGSRPYCLPYELELDAGWETTKETAMQTYNRALRCVRGLQLPSPISEPSTPARVTRLAYTFKDQVRPKAIALEGCLCLFCNRRDYHTLDRLHHHFKAEHDMFIFKLRKAEKMRSDRIVTEVDIEVDVSDKYSRIRASNHVADPREIAWVAPWEPFDLEAYLKGDESWIATGLGLRSKKQRQLAKPAPLPQGSVEPKRPSEVQDMPKLEKRKYRVPRAPGKLRFYRTDSKRPLDEGEYLSESDDGISEDWLKLRRNVATNDAETTVPAKAFMMKWDDYMQDEQLAGDTHAGDAVIRFARKHRAWLKSREAMGNEFLRKLAEMKDDNIICNEVFGACVNLVEGDGSMIDMVAVPARNGRRHPSPPSASERNGVSPQAKSPRMKRKYVPGGPGGGGRYIEVEDDGKKRKKRTKPATSQDNSIKTYR
ncbi:hypothetical protein B0J12DRAFT_741632 [Macrophomina phaseolina]|uniref:Polycomb protein VEFS-Box domain-containing protein n=1 Tax=Macrophomina phaseolina TaxID=35725 RepID=A0ABQ8G6V6_9PEZI|nr:hypothetical protein B0J12DRAFT_741632 [Macrophomina phaseolina]